MTKPKPPTDRIRLTEAATLLGCHPATLRRYALAGKIRTTIAERTYLFISPSEIERARSLVQRHAKHRPKAAQA